jgi:hypothetical protein
MKIYILATALLALVTCAQEVLVPKRTQILTFPIDNKNERAFGYKIGSDGIPVSVSDIVISNSRIYAVDAAHCNIKIIDIQSGKITCSEKIHRKNEDVFLSRILDCNDYLYVTSDNGAIYKLSKAGRLLKVIAIADYSGSKYIYESSNKSFTIFNDADFEQREDEKVSLHLKRIDYDDNVRDTIVVLNDLRAYSKVRQRIRGKQYILQTLNEKTVLDTDFDNFQISKTVPKLPYSCSNLDFRENEVVYFNVNSKTLQFFYSKY